MRTGRILRSCGDWIRDIQIIGWLERTWIESALARLDRDDRAVVWLHDVEGYNHREIAGQPSGVIEIPLDVTAIADAIEEAQSDEAMEDTATRTALEQTPLFSALSPESLMPQ